MGLILVKDITEDYFCDFIKNHGQKTKGIIIEAEQYTGDGFHSGDTCFKGKFKFKDHRARQHTGKFSRYCFEPYDFANFEFPIESVEEAYSQGSVINVYYLKWLPFIHTEWIQWRKIESLNTEDEGQCNIL